MPHPQTGKRGELKGEEESRAGAFFALWRPLKSVANADIDDDEDDEDDEDGRARFSYLSRENEGNTGGRTTRNQAVFAFVVYAFLFFSRRSQMAFKKEFSLLSPYSICPRGRGPPSLSPP